MSISAEAGSSCDRDGSPAGDGPSPPARDGPSPPACDGRQQQQTPPRGKSLTLTILMRNCELSSTIIQESGIWRNEKYVAAEINKIQVRHIRH